MKCHSGPAVAGEESPVIFGTIFRGNSQRCFASLNMTAPLKDDFMRSRARFPLTDGKLQRISPTFSQSRPSADVGQGEFCSNQASPDNRGQTVYRNSAGFCRP